MNAPLWAKGCNASFVEKIWNEDELSSLGLKKRMNTLHPSPVIRNLQPYQRARVWRYLRDAMGLSYYTEIASIFASVDNDTDGHLRVKEIFESFEAYKVLSNFIIAAQRTVNDIQSKNNNTMVHIPEIKKIVELACGHGLVGILLAYRFPKLQVYLYDLNQRPTFASYLRAFENHGFKRPGESKVLPNIYFFEADLRTCPAETVKDSVVICVHGCGDVNQDTIEMALRHGAGVIVFLSNIFRILFISFLLQKI